MDQRDAFAAELSRRRDDAGLSLADLARVAHVSRGHIGHLEHAQRWPSRVVVAALDDALGARGALSDAWSAGDAQPAPRFPAVDTAEFEAMELARRVSATDLGGDTLDRLEAAVDDLATAYPVATPEELLVRVRAHLARYLAPTARSTTTAMTRRRRWPTPRPRWPGWATPPPRATPGRSSPGCAAPVTCAAGPAGSRRRTSIWRSRCSVPTGWTRPPVPPARPSRPARWSLPTTGEPWRCACRRGQGSARGRRPAGRLRAPAAVVSYQGGDMIVGEIITASP